MAKRTVNENAPFTRRVKAILRQVPRGQVVTYGLVAALAGNHRAARQVTWILHASSERDRLPWHRVVNGRGRISLAPGQGYELQRSLLEAEGVELGLGDRIDLDRYLWRPADPPVFP